MELTRYLYQVVQSKTGQTRRIIKLSFGAKFSESNVYIYIIYDEQKLDPHSATPDRSRNGSILGGVINALAEAPTRIAGHSFASARERREKNTHRRLPGVRAPENT